MNLKTVLPIIALLLVGSTQFEMAHARGRRTTPINYLTDRYMKMANLDGLKVTHSEDKNDILANYSFTELEKLPRALKSQLENESASTIISRVYNLESESSFKNIYYYIGKTEEGTYELAIVFHNSSNSMFVVDMNITAADLKSLSLIQDGEKYTATVSEGSTIFPY